MNKLILLTFMLKIVFHFFILKKCQASISSNLIVNNVNFSSLKEPFNRTYGEFCGENYICIEKFNLTCNNHTCKCILGEIWSKNDEKCVAFEYGSCNQTIQCQDQDPNRICSDNKCRCKKGYEIRSKICVPENPNIETTIGTTIGTILDTTKSTLTTNSLSSDTSIALTTVHNKKTHNQSCYSSYQCDDKLICLKDLCKCPEGYMWSSLYKQCLSFANSYCDSSSQCQDVDSHRVCSFHRCQCKKGYKASIHSPLCEKVVGRYCSFDCSDIPNSICYNHNCICRVFYEPSDDFTQCDLIRCRSDSECKFNGSHVNNAKCDLYCSCSTGYYNTDKSCDKSSFFDEPDGLNFLWIILIIPLVGLCVCIKLTCQRAVNNRRTEQSLRNVDIHVNRSAPRTNTTSLNSVYTMGSDLTLNQNSYVLTDLSSQESQSAPPYDHPPTYEEAIAAR